MAYAPLSASAWTLRDPRLNDLNLLGDPVITELATKYGKTVGQIILNWHIKGRGHMVIPKTTKLERLEENIQIYDFTMTDEEYKKITALNRDARLFNPKYIHGYGWNGLPFFD